jgi:hypothetical protein
MLMQPNFGTLSAARASGFHFALAFFLLSAVFMPGVLLGYSSTYPLPRGDFFRACGRNLWRFIRLMIIAGIGMGAVAGGLFSAQGALVKAAGESTNELLPFEVRMLCLCIIFLVMTALRIGFDLAESDVVLSDQNAVRRSISMGFRHARRNMGSLLGSYVLTTIVALIILAVGLLVWVKLVPSPSVLGAFLVSQLMLLLLLIPRFWQRAIAVSYFLENMVAPIAVSTVSPAAQPPLANPPAESPAV